MHADQIPSEYQKRKQKNYQVDAEDVRRREECLNFNGHVVGFKTGGIDFFAGAEIKQICIFNRRKINQKSLTVGEFHFVFKAFFE